MLCCFQTAEHQSTAIFRIPGDMLFMLNMCLCPVPASQEDVAIGVMRQLLRASVLLDNNNLCHLTEPAVVLPTSFSSMTPSAVLVLPF